MSTYWDATWTGRQKYDSYAMRNELANGLKTFQISQKPFDFCTYLKKIVNKPFIFVMF